MSQREPGLQEVLASSFDYMMTDVYTAMPGIVVSVEDMGQSRITVQPAINMVSQDMLDITARPPIMDVPVLLPCSKDGGLTFPLQAGDAVTMVFSMRGLDAWKGGNGYPTTPTDRRRFDMRDCIAIPGSFPFGQSPNQSSKRTLAHDPNDVVLVHNIGTGSEVEIRLKAGSGDVVVNAPNAKVTVNCKDSEVNAKNSVTYNTNKYEIKCVSYKVTAADYGVQTGNYSLDVDQGGTNTSTGVFRMNGSFILNGVAHESHVHVETNSITQGPQN